MKHLKLWESHQSHDEIRQWCEQFGIANYTINDEGLVDVVGNVFIWSRWKQLNGHYDALLDKTLPIKFGTVTGHFIIRFTRITSLVGGPKSVGGDYSCASNPQLTSLIGSPTKVPKRFECSFNSNLSNLEGAPNEIGGSFVAKYLKLTSFEGGPEKIGGNLSLDEMGALRDDHDLRLTRKHISYEGFPKIINNKPSSEWIITQINKPFNERGIYISSLSRLPEYVLTPHLLSIIRTKYPQHYKLIKSKQRSEDQWGTDLQADAGEYGL